MFLSTVGSGVEAKVNHTGTPFSLMRGDNRGVNPGSIGCVGMADAESKALVV